MEEKAQELEPTNASATRSINLTGEVSGAQAVWIIQEDSNLI
jgi:hypothetical protein